MLAELPVMIERQIGIQEVVNLHLTVQDRIREAALVIWRQPRTAEERYLSAGNRCSWPQYVRDWHAYGSEKAKMPKIPPQPKDIDRCDQVLDWICWLAAREPFGVNEPEEAVILWRKFGMCERTKVVARRLGIHRQTVRRKGDAGIARVLTHFYAQVAY